MFYYISGKLALLTQDCAVVDAGGVGYKMTVSETTAGALPRPVDGAKDVKLFTYLSVREDGIELYGFADESELYSFKLLISVSGVGPKAAMSILSLLTPERFALAVCTEDKKAISKANGIGPKTAARIILELKDKLAKSAPDLTGSTLSDADFGVAPSSSGKLAEAQDALTVLGYSRAEALNILKDIDTSSMELEDILRAALKKLSK